MSDWEVKNSWQKSNGDWVLTVGPGVEPAGGIFGGTIIFCLMVLETFKGWDEYGALAFLYGMIHSVTDIFLLLIGFYQHFWLMLAWSVAAGLAWGATFMESLWILKIPGFLALLWVLNQMLILARTAG